MVASNTPMPPGAWLTTPSSNADTNSSTKPGPFGKASTGTSTASAAHRRAHLQQPDRQQATGVREHRRGHSHLLHAHPHQREGTGQEHHDDYDHARTPGLNLRPGQRQHQDREYAGGDTAADGGHDLRQRCIVDAMRAIGAQDAARRR
jgi:hypothetical protein